MPHTHFTFQKRQSEMRERRLIREDGVDKYKKDPSAAPSSAEVSKVVPKVSPELNKEVFDTLKISPDYKGDIEAQKLLKDEKILTMIASIVTIRDDNRVNWLPETAQMFAEKYLDVFLSEPKKVEGMKGQATDSVVEFSKVLDKNIGAVTSVKDATKPLPDVENVLKILKAMRASDEVLSAHQHALIDMMNSIIKTDVIDEKFVDAIFKPFTKRNDLSQIMPRLKEIVNTFTAKTSSLPEHARGDTIERIKHPDLYARAQSAMLDEVVRAGRLMLVGPEEGSYDRKMDERRRADLAKAKEDSKTELASLKKQEEDLFEGTDYVKARNSYLEWLSGKNLGQLIAESMKENGMLDVQLFITNIKKKNDSVLILEDELKSAMGIENGTGFSIPGAKVLAEKFAAKRVKVTDTELCAAAKDLLLNGFTEAKKTHKFLEQWMVRDLLALWNTDKLGILLKDRGVLKNHITSSMSHIILRSYIDDEAAEILVGNGIEGLSIGTLMDLAKVAKLDSPTFVAAVSEKIEGDEDRRVVDKEKFIQVVTFLTLNNFGSRVEGEKIWNSLAQGESDSSSIKVETFRLNRTFATIGITDIAFQYMEKIRSKGDSSLTTQMRDLTLSGLDTVKRGSAEWWEMIKRMPGYYIGNKIDAELLAIAKRRDDLNTYTAAIDSTLAAANGTANPIAKSRDQLLTINTAQRAAKSRPTLPNGAIDNVEKGYTMVMASAYVIEQLRGMGWSTLPKKAQMIALSIAMRDKAGDGIESAKTFIKLFNGASGDTTGLEFIRRAVPDAVNLRRKIQSHVPQFKLEKIETSNDYDHKSNEEQAELLFAALEPEQRQELFLQIYLGSGADFADVRNDMKRFQDLTQMSGESILEGPKNAHELGLRESAMTALMGAIRTKCPNGDLAMLPLEKKSMLVRRWMTDRTGSKVAKDAIEEALRIVVKGPDRARDALIKAFLEQTNQEYDHTDGTKKTITAIEAKSIVGQFQTVLQTKAAQGQPAKEQLSGKDVRSNPVERGVRATLETIKDLWDGDMVNKATVIATLLVSLWAIRKAWNEAGKKDAPGWTKLLKAGLIATPLLIVGNAAVKRQTGKDYLGEWFSYMPKEKRNAPLESFRRRSAEETRYDFMDSAAGHEALRQLTGSKVKIPICDLIKWRESIAQSSKDGELGSDVYEHGAPKNLKISAIRSVRPGMTKDEAYKTAYLAFEALCVDVAVIKGLGGGTLDEKANEGADFIEKRYVAFEGYADRPKEQEQLKKRSMTMLEIIIDIANTPETIDAMKDYPNFIESLAKGLGWTIEKTEGMFVKLSTQAKIRMMRTGELAPEILEGVWGQVKETSSGIYDWWRVTRPKISNDMKVQFDAALRLTADTLDSLGIVVKQSGGAIEWSINKATDLTNFSLESLQRAYEALQGVGVTGEPIRLIDSIAFSVTGFTMSEWILYGRSKKANGKAVDLMQTPELFNKELATFIDGLKLVVTGQKISADWEKGARKSLGITTEIKDCTPAERALAMERIKRRVYSRLLDARITKAEDAAKTDDQNAMSHALDYPLPAVDLGQWDTLAQGRAQTIEEHYGIPMLALLGSEKTQFIGALRQYIDSHKDGVIKTTLDFGHKFATIPNRDDSLEYLDAINVFINQNMREAQGKFAELPEAERNQKLTDYRSMLETVLTNAVIDMTLRNGKSLGLATDALHPSSHEGVPFLLTITNAKEFRNFLALKRGAIADPSSTEKYIDKFHRKDGSENLIHGILKDKNISKILAGINVEEVAATLGQQEIQRPEDLGDLIGSSDKPENAAQRSKIIETLPAKGLTDPERQALIGRIDAEARAIATVDDASIKDALEILGGTSSGAARTLEAKILTYTASKNALAIEKIAQNISGARKLAGTEAGREHLQHVLDRVVTQQLKRVVEEMKNVSKQDLKTRRDDWEPQLLKLYGMTKESTDRLSDCVAYALEYLLYQGNHDEADKKNNTNFKKFEAYLKEKELKAPAEKSYHFNTSNFPAYFEYENGSRARMAKSAPKGVGSTYLDNLSGRIKVLEDELSK